MNVRFFTRHDLKGWRVYSWIIVAMMQGRFVHCEVESGGVVVNADCEKGVELKAPIDRTPSVVLHVPHNGERYHAAVQAVLGLKYSWAGFFRLCLPRWGEDPKGMICSELVAYLIAESATEAKHRYVFQAIPPYRWTPNAIQQALIRIGAF